MQVKNDLIGKKFDRLTVLEKIEKRSKNGDVYWKCECECGEIKNVTTFNLNRGHAKSCGCLYNETISKNAENKKVDLNGAKYGFLTVIGETSKRDASGAIKWLCRCECGNKKIISGQRLINKDTKSCGCEKKKKTEEIFKKSKEDNCKEGTNLLLLTEKDRINNTSGIKGVYFNKAVGKFQAFITFKRKQMYLGVYESIADAAKARKEAEYKYFDPILEKYGRNNMQ